MQRIVPHLWFDTEARQAAEFYVRAFENSIIQSEAKITGTPSGDVDLITIQIAGHEFTLINAGPYFKFTPAVSFLVACRSKEEVDALWNKLGESASELMPLGAYPFSERYVWLQDQYGLSWQIMYVGDREIQQAIVPTLMFVGDQCGRAEEALAFYTSVFHASGVSSVARYGPDAEPNTEDMIMHASFRLETQEFALMESALDHGFGFNEAISLMIYCDTQEEIDYYWDALSAFPEAEQCGWLKDQFGFSWQVVPRAMDELFRDQDPDKLARVNMSAPSNRGVKGSRNSLGMKSTGSSRYRAPL